MPPQDIRQPRTPTPRGALGHPRGLPRGSHSPLPGFERALASLPHRIPPYIVQPAPSAQFPSPSGSPASPEPQGFSILPVTKQMLQMWQDWHESSPLCRWCRLLMLLTQLPVILSQEVLLILRSRRRPLTPRPALGPGCGCVDFSAAFPVCPWRSPLSPGPSSSLLSSLSSSASAAGY